ncbi:integrase [Mycobacterium phage Anthony]|uniref:Integrase n=1 Tax=Mycobacterium phage Anthony TaxID=2599857 RepID=A0A5J6TK62_9CAUD|nr:integrase [Mycobacterium phage Anthony]QFG10404.1 integrase [Mycobacterium phage Anthony]
MGRTRISRSTEESTSIERQREFIAAWAEQNGHEVIGWAEDIDVSGSLDPFETPSLGEWLKDERLHEWDIIVSWKLDRITRRAIPMGKLFGWLMENQKTLVCTSDSIDLSTPMGRLIAYVIATIAEGELEAIRERSKVSHKKLKELGRYAGGRVLYGQRPVAHEDAGWKLDIDEHAAEILNLIIDKLFAGQSVDSIAFDLNEMGELSPSDYQRQWYGNKVRGTKWSSTAIRRLLRSKSLLGYATEDGATMRDSKGAAILRAPALVTREKYDRIQSELEARSRVPQRTLRASPLLGIVLCLDCGQRMYYYCSTRNPDRKYYYCQRDHGRVSIRAERAADDVESLFLEKYGDMKIREKVFIQAENHEVELEDARKAVEEISSFLSTASSATVRSRLMEQLGALDSRITELEALPSRDARWEFVDGKQTYGEAWKAANTDERRALLLKWGITVSFRRRGNAVESVLNEPEDALNRLTA